MGKEPVLFKKSDKCPTSLSYTIGRTLFGTEYPVNWHLSYRREGQRLDICSENRPHAVLLLGHAQRVVWHLHAILTGTKPQPILSTNYPSNTMNARVPNFANIITLSLAPLPCVLVSRNSERHAAVPLLLRDKCIIRHSSITPKQHNAHKR